VQLEPVIRSAAGRPSAGPIRDPDPTWFMPRRIRRVRGGWRSRSAGATAAFLLCAELSRFPIAAPGTICGNHRAHSPRHLRASPGMVFALQLHELIPKAGTRSLPYSAYKRGVTGSNPVAPTKFLQLDGIFETLIGDSATTAGNHRCMLPDGRRVPRGHGSIPFDHHPAPCADGRHHRH
jgi:hypothetical protein